MSEFDWQRLLYLLAWLIVMGPAAFMLWRTHGKFWRDLLLWGGIVGAAVLLYLVAGPQ